MNAIAPIAQTGTSMVKAATIKNILLQTRTLKAPGAGIFRVVSRGNTHIRNNGQVVTIYNVAAFDSLVARNAAIAAFHKGRVLEESGDLEGAQDFYNQARNLRMSFSILMPNRQAAEFASCYEVSAAVELAASPNDKLGRSQKLVLNNVRPVALELAGDETSESDIEDYAPEVEEEEEEAAPVVTAKAPKTPKAIK